MTTAEKINIVLLSMSYKILKKRDDEFARLAKPNMSIFAEKLANSFKKYKELKSPKSGTIRNYFSTIKTTGDFANLKVNSILFSCLLQFCDCLNEDDLILKSTDLKQSDVDQMCIVLKLQEKKINLFDLSLTGKSFSYLKPDSYFENLEFVQKKHTIEVNCITYNLKWASEHIPKHQERIKKRNNIYRYLLTEEMDSTYLRKLKKHIERDEDLSKKIYIKSLSNHRLYKNFPTDNIVIPINNDIVIYKKINPASKQPEILEAIIGARPFDIENANSSENVSLVINLERAYLLYDWFDTIWSEI